MRTAALFSGLFILSSLVSFGILFWSATHDVTAQLREAVQQDVRALVTLYEHQGRAPLVNNISVLASSVEAKRSLYLLENNDGTVIAGNVPRIAPVADWQVLSFALSSHRSDHFLIYGMHLGDLWLFVGRRAHNVWEIQEAILRAFGWAFMVTIPIALVGGLILAHRMIRRVDTIGLAMEQYLDGDLSRRVPETQKGDEIDRLAANINNVLGQIEKLINGMKQVTSDVAHDLRTPLSRLRQRLESSGSNASGETDRNTAAAIAEVDEILSTFDALLRIAEIEAGAKSTQLTQTDLSGIGRFLYETYITVAEDSGQTLVADISPGLSVRGNRHLLTQLVVNLIENAIRHTPPGSSIKLSICKREGSPILEITDSGPGIPAVEREHVFKRFYRLDASRTTPGSGLGLALVKSVADLHGATITLSDAKPGLVVTIQFPH